MGIDREAADLELHVELCAQRYQNLEQRFCRTEEKLEKLQEESTENYKSLDAGLKSLRESMEDYKTKQFNKLLGWATSAITALGAGLIWALLKLLNL